MNRISVYWFPSAALFHTLDTSISTNWRALSTVLLSVVVHAKRQTKWRNKSQKKKPKKKRIHKKQRHAKVIKYLNRFVCKIVIAFRFRSFTCVCIWVQIVCQVDIGRLKGGAFWFIFMNTCKLTKSLSLALSLFYSCISFCVSQNECKWKLTENNVVTRTVMSVSFGWTKRLVSFSVNAQSRRQTVIVFSMRFFVRSIVIVYIVITLYRVNLYGAAVWTQFLNVKKINCNKSFPCRTVCSSL